MKKIFTSILAIVMSLGLVVTETACSASQVGTAINVVNSQLPVALGEAAIIASLAGNTSVAAFMQTASGLVSTDGPVIKDAVAAWKSATGTDKTAKFNALTAVVTSLASNVNVQFLQANKVATTQDEQLAVASLGALSLVLNGMAIALTNAGGVSAAMTVPTSQVASLYQKKDVEALAKVYGVSYDQAVKLLNS